MKDKLGNFVVVALAAQLSGCAVTTFTLDNPAKLAASGSVAPEQATIYVMRNNSKASALWAANVWTDGIRRGSLWEKSYVRYSIAPGEHDITIKRSFMSGVPSLAVKSTFEAGMTYYFMIGTDFRMIQGDYRFAGEVGQIPAQAAQPLLKYYVNANEGLSTEDATPATDTASDPKNPKSGTAQ